MNRGDGGMSFYMDGALYGSTLLRTVMLVTMSVDVKSGNRAM